MSAAILHHNTGALDILLHAGAPTRDSIQPERVAAQALDPIDLARQLHGQNNLMVEQMEVVVCLLLLPSVIDMP